MKIDDKEVKETIRCWCGLEANFHHISTTRRRDRKRTVWYKCDNGHRVYDDIDDLNNKIYMYDMKDKDD